MTSSIEPPRIYPTFRYKKAATMIDWLQEAFGFTVHAKHMDGKKSRTPNLCSARR